MNLQQFNEQNSDLKPGETRRDVQVVLGGRVYSKREAGGSLVFYDIKDGSTMLQVFCQMQDSEFDTVQGFAWTHSHIKRGDIVGVVGYPGRTKPQNREDGTLSVFATQISVVVPCLHQLPYGHKNGFKDQEQRARKRFLDWIINEDSKSLFTKRCDTIKHIRQYFWDRSFLETETPTLGPIASGAAAQPFTTHFNSLKREFFLRIAPELPLKKMIGGGYEGVFEIGKQFRNEGIDPTHNPEFTTCEFYAAWRDYYDLMDVTEDIVSHLVYLFNDKAGYKTTYNTLDGKEYTINWEKPWRRIDIMPALEEKCGEKFPPADQLHTPTSTKFLQNLLEKTKVECAAPQTNPRMLDALIGEFLEPECVQPTLLINHPRIMSPLAKEHRSIPGICERFEAFVCTKEIANAYTELNDPFEQRQRFEEQAAHKAAGDEEAQLIDDNFLHMLEYGMAPCAGWGMGIDRLVMFMGNKNSIKDVLAFPIMLEPKKKVEKAKEGPKLPQGPQTMANLSLAPANEDTVPGHSGHVSKAEQKHEAQTANGSKNTADVSEAG